MMSHRRSPEFPGAPTLRELGYNLVAEGFVGVGGPKGMPKEIVVKLEHAFAQAVKDTAYLDLIKKLALMEDYRPSQEFSRFVPDSYNVHGKLIQTLGLDALKK
jgi:tripartite-type tricarboxylate transporter receptor subunit TctC